MTTQSPINKREQAIHEAAHAVVMAHLELPFEYATVYGYDLGGKVQTPLYKELLNLPEEDQECFIESISVALIAARAAVDIARGQDSAIDEYGEYSYASDEEQLLTFGAVFIDKPENYIDAHLEWRKEMLRRAREILSIPYVWNAVERVAEVLKSMAAFGGDALPFSFIKGILEDCKRSFPQEETH